MTSIRVASQLNGALNQAFADLPGVEILPVPQHPPLRLPDGVEVLIASPTGAAGAGLPAAPPPGWPFDARWVQLVSVGIDAYPAWLFRGPVVTAARGASAVALAEFAIATIFAAAKRLPDIWIRAAADWAPSPLGMVQGQTLGLVGFGALGEALAPRAQALGMKVLATRRSAAPIGTPGVERLDDLGQIFEQSDHVVLAAPATPQTFRLVDREVLRRAKPGLHLVNLARGSLIDDEALLEALDEGRVALASLDVALPEPLPADHRFYLHPRVRLSPHTSVHTPDTLSNLLAHFAENLDRFRANAPLIGVVDPARGY
ncbi:MAG: NAD(P)-dependent oxidoreductase [Phenylobacterium sp.]|uniref:NAD(P)-dependent oxidoreductase n=1 Tax=Phenylobacterium sp. TaxID=1871053 RepID=UPI0027349530|nr:NAD(P)-dependent oxidoreductase [Phenylobacterium sp.]MDP3747675.1 NAD(P)-dependent oxidoreductase [Phenylobacterium sp.]